MTSSIVYHGNGGVVTASAAAVITSAPRHGRSGSVRQQHEQAGHREDTKAAVSRPSFPGTSMPSSRNLVPLL